MLIANFGIFEVIITYSAFREASTCTSSQKVMGFVRGEEEGPSGSLGCYVMR